MITADGGASFNSVPRFDNATQHSRTNGAQGGAQITAAYIFNLWFQAGVSISYLTLSYQDDYSGPIPNSWHTVYAAKPVIPLQLFARATIVGPTHWRANVALSAGYGLVTRSGTKGGPTAGLTLGIDYFFNCRWGLGASFTGQWLDTRSAAMAYQVMALPILAGVRYRF